MVPFSSPNSLTTPNCNSWGRKESGMTERLTLTLQKGDKMPFLSEQCLIIEENNKWEKLEVL